MTSRPTCTDHNLASSESVEGMALDAGNRLLYWTDSVLGTVELLDLTVLSHATVIEYLNSPRAISLDPSVGLVT